MLQSPADKFALDWSPDGQYLLYLQAEGVTATGALASSLMALPLRGEAKPVLLLKSPLYDTGGRFSSDGHWIVFSSRMAGPRQVFVIPFPGPGTPKQISSSFGLAPLWRKDGKAILYLNAENSVMETEVEAKGNDLAIGKTQLLFKAKAKNSVTSYTGYPFDVSPDGQRFIVNSHTEQNSQEITVIANWVVGLKN
jgi:Tol biopolymer transport system component